MIWWSCLCFALLHASIPFIGSNYTLPAKLLGDDYQWTPKLLEDHLKRHGVSLDKVNWKETSAELRYLFLNCLTKMDATIPLNLLLQVSPGDYEKPVPSSQPPPPTVRPNQPAPLSRTAEFLASSFPSRYPSSVAPGSTAAPPSLTTSTLFNTSPTPSMPRPPPPTVQPAANAGQYPSSSSSTFGSFPPAAYPPTGQPGYRGAATAGTYPLPNSSGAFTSGTYPPSSSSGAPTSGAYPPSNFSGSYTAGTYPPLSSSGAYRPPSSTAYPSFPGGGSRFGSPPPPSAGYPSQPFSNPLSSSGGFGAPSGTPGTLPPYRFSSSAPTAYPPSSSSSGYSPSTSFANMSIASTSPGSTGHPTQPMPSGYRPSSSQPAAVPFSAFQTPAPLRGNTQPVPRPIFSLDTPSISTEYSPDASRKRPHPGAESPSKRTKPNNPQPANTVTPSSTPKSESVKLWDFYNFVPIEEKEPFLLHVAKDLLRTATECKIRGQVAYGFKDVAVILTTNFQDSQSERRKASLGFNYVQAALPSDQTSVPVGRYTPPRTTNPEAIFVSTPSFEVGMLILDILGFNLNLADPDFQTKATGAINGLPAHFNRLKNLLSRLLVVDGKNRMAPDVILPSIQGALPDDRFSTLMAQYLSQRGQ